MRALFIIMIASLGALFSQSATAQGPDVTDIVEADAAYAANPTKSTRADLLSALGAYTGDATVESVKAHLTVMVDDIRKGDDERMLESASAAVAHLEPVAEILPKNYIEARYIAALASFNVDQTLSSLLEMAHVEGRLNEITDDTSEQPEWARNLEYKALAWRLAIAAYFDSSRETRPSDEEIEAILAEYEPDAAAQYEQSLSDTGLPPCSGRMIQRPSLRYPRNKVMRGMFGAVILGFEFDSDGNVINPRVLASVPIEEFDEKSLRVVGKWTFKPDDSNQVGVTCRIERQNVVQPLVFQIQ